MNEAKLIWKKLTYSQNESIPNTAIFYKAVNGKSIYKDRYSDEFYVVYRYGMGYVVEKYRGECRC